MGRRALRRIDPSLDLSPYLFELDDLPRPCTAESLFGAPAPLEVEVGSGKGLFLRRAAADHPEHRYLGIEIVRKYARFAAAALAKRGLTAAKVVAGDGMRLFDEFLPDGSLEAVHVYFPDPWWKKRHRKRRVMREPFLRHVERSLRPGGTLHFWTDVEEYFDESLELIARVTTLDGPHPVPEQPAEDDMDYRTHFERRMRQHNEPVYRSQFTRPPVAGGPVNS
jgi:tRNA (guanine-N7-)-methyltransferase